MQAFSDQVVLGRTVEILGGKAAFPHPIRSRLEAHDALRVGLRSVALQFILETLALDKADLTKAIGISLRTLQRYREEPGRLLSPEQSGRAWKFAEVLARATEVFGSRAEAERWLERPAIALDQRKPIELLSTPTGVEMVEDHLTRLEYGVYT
jgi:putative toxin-antitoxin system antitoxin component (TIGR02293 family)